MSLPKPLRRPLKLLSSLISIDVYQRMLTFSIMRRAYPQIATLPIVSSRRELWNYTIENFLAPERPLIYLEFGVWKGESILYFAERNRNDSSRFFGFDSFEGLPEKWGPNPKGTFDRGGVIPNTKDARIRFIKGWFQDSWDSAYGSIRDCLGGSFAVHYDADLYSSTLFALTKVDSFKRSYIAIFDEFTGEEARALYNYCQAYGAAVQFFVKTMLEDDPAFPSQLACRITPKNCVAS